MRRQGSRAGSVLLFGLFVASCSGDEESGGPVVGGAAGAAGGGATGGTGGTGGIPGGSGGMTGGSGGLTGGTGGSVGGSGGLTGGTGGSVGGSGGSVGGTGGSVGGSGGSVGGTGGSVGGTGGSVGGSGGLTGGTGGVTGGTGGGPAPGELDPYERVQALGRGINLGNALDAPNEGEWGVTLQASYFPTIRSAGFDSVRIPIRWSAHAGQSAPYTIDATFFNRVDWAIDQALSAGLLAVINVHHYEEIFSNPQAHRARWIGLWEQIAIRYQNRPGDLLFEILNEPHDAIDASLWNDMANEAIAKIRESNPGRTIVVGGVEWNQYSTLADLNLPAADRNLIATFHYYLPMPFTHQGASWVSGSDAWLGTTWNSTPSEEADIRSHFDTVASWATANDRPIYLGEFGAYERADMASRERWTAFVARSAEERGFAWAYWEFCSGFGAYDSSTGTWRPELLRALVPP